MKTTNSDTIAAISTPLGEGGIAIVRLSGGAALAAADSIFGSCEGKKPSTFATHTVHYGSLKSGRTGEVVDEVMLTVMRSPKTYTREDIVEISCHGGAVTARKVLAACIWAGARPAEPGEFTRRAFLNGRIDLSQAEAVLDIISAETDAAQKAALDQLKGSLSDEIRGMRSSVLDALSKIELTIDFSQEDVAFPEAAGIKEQVGALCRSVGKILATADKGMMLRRGASIVICGRPNVGKSSLMNALLRHDRVIVSPQAGTTRDVIEESIEIAGVKVRLSDTAGIIDTTDRVEIEGIRRSREKLARADAVVFTVDLSVPLSSRDRDIFSTVMDKKVVVVANKADLPPAWDVKETSRKFGDRSIISVSALKGTGLLELERALADALPGASGALPEGAVVTNARHKDLLERTELALSRALDAAEEKPNPELMASDLNEAVHLLGLITGESVEDDVLERIFSQFCIGK